MESLGYTQHVPVPRRGTQFLQKDTKGTGGRYRGVSIQEPRNVQSSWQGRECLRQLLDSRVNGIGIANGGIRSSLVNQQAELHSESVKAMVDLVYETMDTMLTFVHFR